MCNWKYRWIGIALMLFSTFCGVWPIGVYNFSAERNIYSNALNLEVWKLKFTENRWFGQGPKDAQQLPWRQRLRPRPSDSQPHLSFGSFLWQLLYSRWNLSEALFTNACSQVRAQHAKPLLSFSKISAQLYWQNVATQRWHGWKATYNSFGVMTLKI